MSHLTGWRSIYVPAVFFLSACGGEDRKFEDPRSRVGSFGSWGDACSSCFVHACTWAYRTCTLGDKCINVLTTAPPRLNRMLFHPLINRTKPHRTAPYRTLPYHTQRNFQPGARPNGVLSHPLTNRTNQTLPLSNRTVPYHFQRNVPRPCAFRWRPAPEFP